MLDNHSFVKALHISTYNQNVKFILVNGSSHGVYLGEKTTGMCLPMKNFMICPEMKQNNEKIIPVPGIKCSKMARIIDCSLTVCLTGNSKPAKSENK